MQMWSLRNSMEEIKAQPTGINDILKWMKEVEAGLTKGRKVIRKEYDMDAKSWMTVQDGASGERSTKAHHWVGTWVIRKQVPWNMGGRGWGGKSEWRCLLSRSLALEASRPRKRDKYLEEVFLFLGLEICKCICWLRGRCPEKEKRLNYKMHQKWDKLH